MMCKADEIDGKKTRKIHEYIVLQAKTILTQSAGAVLYTPTVALQKGKNPSPKECPVYDTEQSDGEVPVMLELLVMQSTLS